MFYFSVMFNSNLKIVEIEKFQNAMQLYDIVLAETSLGY